jgi:hypothetical protein
LYEKELELASVGDGTLDFIDAISWIFDAGTLLIIEIITGRSDDHAVLHVIIHLSPSSLSRTTTLPCFSLN